MKKIDLMSFQETRNSGMCGPASLKIVLNYFGIQKTEEELAKLCKTDSELGTDADSIISTAESLGLTTEKRESTSFEDLDSFLERKMPAIVDWFSPGNDFMRRKMPDGHYSVVCGLDDKKIYLQDPEIGGVREIERGEFERVWFDFSGPLIKPAEIIIRQAIGFRKE